MLKLGRRPTILDTVEDNRERRIGFVMFTVDCEANIGRRRIPKEEVAEYPQKKSDIMIAFASIDPRKRKMGVREARRLIGQHGVRGLKFNPTMQGFFAEDRLAYPLYEVVAEHQLPAGIP